MTCRDDLVSYLKTFGLKFGDEVCVKIANFVLLLEKWNKAYNLTSTRFANDIMVQHVLDSLSVEGYILGPRILDVGSGAGFPGIPLALIFPEFHFTLIDSNGKKTRFLKQVLIEVGISNVEVVNGRVEALNCDKCFNTIITRATYSLKEMISKTGYLLCDRGQLLLMKGKYPENELSDFDGSYDIKIHELFVPNLNADRHLICATKTGSIF